MLLCYDTEKDMKVKEKEENIEGKIKDADIVQL